MPGYTFTELVASTHIMPINPWPSKQKPGTVIQGIPCKNEKSFQTAQNKGLPAIVYDDAMLAQCGRVWLCLFGFPAGAPVSLTLYDPQQNEVGEILIDIQDNYREFTLGKQALNFSLGMSHGDWKVLTIIGDQTLKSKFTYPDTGAPFLSVSYAQFEEVLNPVTQQAEAGYQSGETILIEGINFPPGLELPVGLFSQISVAMDNHLQPVAGEVIGVEQDGAFSLRFALPAYLPEGVYKIIPILEPDQGSKYRPRYWLNIELGEGME